MALQKQIVPITLGVGVNTKTDKKQLQIGRLSSLKNAVFKEIGSLRKRFGLTKKGTKILGTTTDLLSSQVIGSYNDELFRITQNEFYSYASGLDSWASKGKVAGATVSSLSVLRNSYQQSAPQLGATSGITVHAWEDSSGGVRASVFDSQSRQVLAANVLLNAGASRPRVVSNNKYIYVYYMVVGSNSFRLRRLNPLTPTAFESEIILGNDANGTDAYFDIAPMGNNFVFVYRLSSGYKLGYLSQSGNIGTAIEGFPAAITEVADPTRALGIIGYSNSDPINDGIYVFIGNGTNIRAFVYDPLLLGSTSVIVDAITNSRQITAVQINPGTVQVIYDVDATETYNRSVKTNTVTRAASAGTATVVSKSVSVYTKPWVESESVYFVASYESELQSTFYTMDIFGNILNRIRYQLAGGGLPKRSTAGQVLDLGSSVYAASLTVKSKLVSEEGDLFTITGVQETRLTFSSNRFYSNAQIGRDLHIAAGLLDSYDGAIVTEHGFNLYPENIDDTINTGSGGITAGTRQYTVVFEWTDQQGLIHRSAPSIPITVVTASGSNNIDITIPTLRITQKPDVSVVIYRTVDAGTTFYRVTSVASPLLNDKTVDTVTFNDALADSAIISNEILYTTGGVLENIAPPSASFVSSYRNRLVITGLEDPNEIWYSKVYTAGEGVAFTDSFKLRCDKGELGVVASSELDEKLLLFKRTNIFVTSGQGPLDTGLQNDFVIPEQVASDVGCTEARSIVQYPEGVLFKSEKGIYRVSRSLQVEYIGAEVEAYNNLTITSAVLVEDQNQVRFTTSDGECLVYDYFTKQWSTFDNYEAVSACVWQGVYHMARSNAEVNAENKEIFLDNTSSISMEFVTPWLSLGQVQGFQRVYQAMLLGDYKQDHVFRVEIGYDFEDFYSEALEVSSIDANGSSYYGKGYYGEEEFIGGLHDWNYEINIKPARQKCSAIRFKVRDINLYSEMGELVVFSHLALLVGIKGGLNRLATYKAAVTK